MGGASQTGLVPLALRVVRGFDPCEGGGVVLGVRTASARSTGGFRSSSGPGLGSGPVPTPAPAVAEGSAARGLAALLGEREADGHRDHAVVLELHDAGDLGWVAEAISWLAAHGRRVLLRTDRVLPRDAVEAARDAGASVLLRIASFDPELQAALLGPSADAAARLLLSAQHLRAQGVAVGVLVAPLMPVVHRDEQLEVLCRHIAAADVQHVSFAIGGWSVARHRILSAVLPFGGATALARAFEIFDLDSIDPAERRRPSQRVATLLQRQARRIAEDAGLRVEVCGCEAHCHLRGDSSRSSGTAMQPFRSLLAPGLFEGLADVG